mgnify:CR=1 FL=1
MSIRGMPINDLNILFLTESREDYLADSLLHGLVSLGLNVVDYPRKDILYQEQRQYKEQGDRVDPITIRGGGFTLYGLLPERPIDRRAVIQRLEAGLFDVVILGQVWRQWGQLLDLAPWLQSIPVVLLDGDDDRRLFHRSGTRLRRYGWQPFPIRSKRCFYAKREWQGGNGSSRWVQMIPTGFSIPAAKIMPLELSAKTQRFASHCVDAEVAAEEGLKTAYAFNSEADYYYNMAASRFAISTCRGGWDCLRHYEIAAAGTLLCFRDLQSKPPSCAPHGLVPGQNCLSYISHADLKAQVERLEANPMNYEALLMGSRRWLQDQTTDAAAKRLLAAVQIF